MLKIKVCRPGPDDVESLHQFFRDVLQDTYAKEGLAHKGMDLDKTVSEKESFLEEDIASGGKKRYFLIAMDGEKVVGTAEFGPAGPTVIDCTDGELRDVTEVGTVYVHPAYQGQGVGTLMLNMICITLLGKGIKEFCLDSEFKNAQKVWERKFGKPAYRMKDYWGEGYDHMVWLKRIMDIPIIFMTV